MVKIVQFLDFDDDSDVEVDNNADAANNQEGTTKAPLKQTFSPTVIQFFMLKMVNVTK